LCLNDEILDIFTWRHCTKKIFLINIFFEKQLKFFFWFINYFSIGYKNLYFVLPNILLSIGNSSFTIFTWPVTLLFYKHTLWTENKMVHIIGWILPKSWYWALDRDKWRNLKLSNIFHLKQNIQVRIVNISSVTIKITTLAANNFVRRKPVLFQEKRFGFDFSTPTFSWLLLCCCLSLKCILKLFCL